MVWDIPNKININAIDVNIVFGKFLNFIKIKDHITEAAKPTAQDLSIKNKRDFENSDILNISDPGSCIIDMTRNMLRTSVKVASTIAEDLIFSDIFIFSTRGITTAGDMLAIIIPRTIESKKDKKKRYLLIRKIKKIVKAKVARIKKEELFIDWYKEWNFKWIPASNKIKAKAISNNISPTEWKDDASNPDKVIPIPSNMSNKTSGILVFSNMLLNICEINIIAPIDNIIISIEGNLVILTF